MLKTRVQAEIFWEAKLGIDIKTPDEVFKEIVWKEGIGALWQGLSASMLGLIHVAVYFPFYEYLKQKKKKKHHTLNSWDIF